MTPFWLKAHASYIDISHPLADHQLTFTGADSALHKALLLKVPLVAEGQLPDETPLTVEITVTNNVSIRQTSDSDPKYGLSDGTNFTGFVTRDQMEYDKLAPCFGIAGSSGKIWPSKWNMTLLNFLLLEKCISLSSLSSLSSWINHGVRRLHWAWRRLYQDSRVPLKRLRLSQGLTLDVYKGKGKERVGIKYIKVITVMKTGDWIEEKWMIDWLGHFFIFYTVVTIPFLKGSFYYKNFSEIRGFLLLWKHDIFTCEDINNVICGTKFTKFNCWANPNLFSCDRNIFEDSLEIFGNLR